MYAGSICQFILALMTAYSLDNHQISWKQGIRICFGFLAAFGLISLLPTKRTTETLVSFAEYPFHFTWCCLSALPDWYHHLSAAPRKARKPFLNRRRSTACCIAPSAVVYFGAFEPFEART
ncbi:MAG: hypothetical protein ACLUOF_10580 [Ruminococcus sp.]